MASSFHAVFALGGTSNALDSSGDMEVRKFSMTFDQSTDQKGCPSSDVHGGFINVTVVCTDNKELFEWMLHPYSRRMGVITFIRDDQHSVLKDVIFDEAYCVRYTEDFEAYDKNVLLVSLVISAKTITMYDVTHDKKGPPWE